MQGVCMGEGDGGIQGLLGEVKGVRAGGQRRGRPLTS